MPRSGRWPLQPLRCSKSAVTTTQNDIIAFILGSPPPKAWSCAVRTLARTLGGGSPAVIATATEMYLGASTEISVRPRAVIPTAPVSMAQDVGRRSGRSAPLDRKARRCRCCRGVPVDHKPPGLTGRPPRPESALHTLRDERRHRPGAALFDASARPQLDMGRVCNPHQSAGRRGGYARDSRWGESLAAVDREPAAGPACGLGCAAENPPCKVATEDPPWCRGLLRHRARIHHGRCGRRGRTGHDWVNSRGPVCKLIHRGARWSQGRGLPAAVSGCLPFSGPSFRRVAPSCPVALRVCPSRASPRSYEPR